MIVYMSVVALTIFCTINIERQVTNLGEKRKYSRLGNLQIMLSAAILIFVSGFRWNVGVDFEAYRLSYNIYKVEWLGKVLAFDEPGMAIIAKAASVIYDSPVSFFVIAALITVLLNVLTIKKYCNLYQMGILLYIFVGSWHGSFNAMRQYLAAAIIFLGHRYIYERKLWKYVMVIAAAMLFHSTALVMLPVYFLANKRVSFKRIVVVACMVLVIRYSYDYLFAIMSFIKESDQTQYDYMLRDVNAIRIVVAFAPLLLALLGRKTKEMQDSETQFYVMMLVVNAGFMLGTSGSTYLARVGIYTECFSALALPRLINCFNSNSKKLVMLLITGLYLIFWLYELNARHLLDFQWSFSYL